MGTRRRFDVDIWSKSRRVVDQRNFDVESTSIRRRFFDVDVLMHIDVESTSFLQHYFDVEVSNGYRRRIDTISSTLFRR